MSELPPEDRAPDDDGGGLGCTWCERGSGLILVAGAVGLLYIGIDLISGGRLSQLLVRNVERAADAIDPAEPGGLADELAEGAPGEPGT